MQLHGVWEYLAWFGGIGIVSTAYGILQNRYLARHFPSPKDDGK